MRVARGLAAFAFLLAGWLLPAHAAEMRNIVTTENADYFGFDLRTEEDVLLDQCEAVCLADQACRAFTYNPKAKWCFLKSDFSTLKPFPGAVAGKVVSVSDEPDIGAPPPLAFFPNWMVDEARRLRADLTNGSQPTQDMGVAALVEAGDSALRNGDPRTAMQNYRSALALCSRAASMTPEPLARAFRLSTLPSRRTSPEPLLRTSSGAPFRSLTSTRLEPEARTSLRRGVV